ncbi:hypothetical protein D7231_11485 [Streptomyces klenkii]|uniref:Uncharacterized protein n=1 Tax=Streptomyces klenkii TaxID=1420899 RepID=A0A3B0BS61_9ACTN|nr:hypothetical protein D7231_11485 [Streptomyces klenkii]
MKAVEAANGALTARERARSSAGGPAVSRPAAAAPESPVPGVPGPDGGAAAAGSDGEVADGVGR